jgi:hypothetical protein
VRKYNDALRIKYNSPVRHAGKFYSWDTLIRLKAQELANYLLGKKADLEFGEPVPTLEKTDSEAIRNHILSMTTAEAKKCGIRKNTMVSSKTSRNRQAPYHLPQGQIEAPYTE